MLAQITIVVLLARILHSFLQPIGQTKFVCNLLAGIVLGPSMLGQRKELRERVNKAKEAPMFESMALLGAIYSMFIVTVKFDAHMLRRTAKSSWKIGLPGFLFPLAVSMGLTFTVGRTISGLKGGPFEHFFSISGISFTFFPVIAQALEELNLTTSELGQLAMSSSLITEVIQWMTSTIQIILMKETSNGVWTLFSILAMIVTCVYVIRPLILVAVKKTPEGKEMKESYVVAMLLGVLVMAFISDFVGATCLIGPMILGLVIPNGPPLGATLVTKIEFLVSEFFLPVFFFRIGLKTNIYSITDWTNFVKLQMIIVLTYAAKTLAVTVAAWFSKIRFKYSLLLGLLMNIKGTIDLLLYGRQFRYQLFDEQCFSQMVLSMLLVTMVVTPIIRFTYKPLVRLGPTTTYSHRQSIQSLESNSELCILCCIHNKESVRNITSLLEASNPTQESPIFTYVIHAVELVGRDTALLVPYKRERKKLDRKNSSTQQMMRAFYNYSKNSRGPVGVQSFTMIAPYKSMHETVCHLADDSLIPLIILPFHDNHQCMVGENVSAGVRQFNMNMQACSPCTVGILVERGLSGRLSIAHFSYNVAVFFIGGPDDREALAYAARMSGNPDVCITVFRIILQSKMEENGNEEEARLDESLVEEFKLKNIGNECVNWREIEVDDGVAVMDAIRNSQGDYDLVLAGRRHVDVSLRDEEMADFVQNAELGVIGDMLASSDFCGGMVNVLVLQESRELSCGAFRSGSTKSTKSDSRF